MKKKVTPLFPKMDGKFKVSMIPKGGKPRPPGSFISPQDIPEPPPPTPDRVRATPKAKKGQN